MTTSERNPLVLVVDDEPRILESIRDLLSDNFDVVASSDPENALDLLKQVQFAVILADQRMPGLTGDQFLARAQALSDATRILVTGYTDIDALIRAVNEGQIHTYISKPWEPAQLRITVVKAADHCRQAVQRKQAAQRLAEQQLALEHSEAALRQQTKLLQSILDSMGDGVLVADENGKIVLMNPAAAAMVGPDALRTPHREWSETYGIYHPGGSLYPANDLPLSRARRGETVDGVELHVRHPRKTADLIVSVNVRPLKDDEGRSRGGVAVVHDITAAKHSQEVVHRAKEEAERANRAKSEFLSRMSHELRTPLNSILGFAQILEMGQLPEDDQSSVAQILKGGQHLLNLINEVLDVARIEAGRLSLSPEPVHLAEVIQEALDLVRPLAQQRNIAIRSQTNGAGYHVKADRQRLRQVLLNLLANGVKYNVEAGEIEVSVGPPANGRIRTSISDTGPGIAPHDRERLFLPFERLAGESLAVEGTGLGLALSKGLVEAMGGTLGVESSPGGGSTFWFELAVAEPTPDPSAELCPRSEESETAEAQRRIVLYIEDNPSNMALMKRITETWGHVQLLGASRGRDGLELARTHQPDLILLDLHLPDISGKEVLERLRYDPATESIPVVIVSADATTEQRQTLMTAGALSYVTKPLNIASMLGLLGAVFDDSQASTERKLAMGSVPRS
ncbi:MAG TPA: response regulator [Bryobacteraceae bacterium]|jgi:PAS domain S-box-containing protein